MLADRPPGIIVNIIPTGIIRRLHETQELTLFRAAQEAIRNAERHGHANQIDVVVAYQPGAVRLTVEDNGKGFQPKDSLDCLAKEGHYGLLGIHERVQHVGGTFRLTSQPGHGTKVDVIIPSQTLDQPTEAVRDPVCGALIQPQQAYGNVIYEGTRYYFCCPVCQGAFQRSPETYVLAAIGTTKFRPE